MSWLVLLGFSLLVFFLFVFLFSKFLGYMKKEQNLHLEGFIVAFLKIIIRDSGAEVMDVVDADAGGEPLEDFGQFIVRAAL